MKLRNLGFDVKFRKANDLWHRCDLNSSLCLLLARALVAVVLVVAGERLCGEIAAQALGHVLVPCIECVCACVCVPLR